MTLIAKAIDLATIAHAGQKRKYTSFEYITHPAAVAQAVANVGGDPEMIAAAWLHDVLEDTTVNFDQLSSLVSQGVAILVDEVTNRATVFDGDRNARARINRDRLRTISNRAKTIKLADSLDNMPSIRAYDPKFAMVYYEEKSLLLPLLVGGDPTLVQKMHVELTSYYGR